MAEVTLSRQKCLNHPAREAAARCTTCARYYCRECVVESRERLVCATCLGVARKPGGPSGRRSASMGLWLSAAAGFTLAWAVFYALGLALLTLPSLGGPGVWGAR